ncbi:MAG: hypothetical protein U1C55_10730 [Smithellaceae bacterium]|nr:hypothetical protein [Smithellaceae bacterium]
MTQTVIYRTNTVYQEPVTLVASKNIRATIMPGPLEFARAVPIQLHVQGAVRMTLGVERHRTTDGQFLVISYIRDPNAGPVEKGAFTGYPRRVDAALATAQVAALILLSHPGLIAEKVFDGVVSDPQNVTFHPEGPLTISTPHMLDPVELSASVQERLALVDTFDETKQSRFRLSSRWFLRGHEAKKPVDRFLYWFIALEVYPAEGRTKVVSAVRNLLVATVYPDVSPGLLSERLSIGRIHGIRSRIVHEGLSHVDLPLDPEFHQALDKLGAISAVCLRVLAGLSPGDDLDRWVRA